METCHVGESLEALEVAISSLCHRVWEGGASPRSPSYHQPRAGWRQRTRYEVKGPVPCCPYWPNTAVTPFLATVSTAVKRMVIPTSKNQGAPTKSHWHSRSLEASLIRKWMERDWGNPTKLCLLAFWTLPHRTAFVLKTTGRPFLLSPSVWGRDPGLSPIRKSDSCASTHTCWSWRQPRGFFS